jgi:archaemetzincin
MLLSRRRALQLSVLAASHALLSRGSAWGADAPLIVVQPLGHRSGAADVDAVVTAVRAFFRVRVLAAEPMALPRSAYYPPRRRYRAERLLDTLVERAPGDARVMLGLTAVDISTTKGEHPDWGVLGLATLGGRAAVLSSFRCARRARSTAHARERLAKTAVHELGHSFGLEHCPRRGCLMHDGEGSVLTTDRETDFCTQTRARLSTAGVLRDDARSPFAPR